MNKNWKVESAGIFIGNYPLSKRQVKVSRELGFDIRGRPKGISMELLKSSDLIIAVTNDLPRGLFNYSGYKNNVIVWKIKDDISGGREEGTRKIIRSIMKEADKLIKKLEKKK